METCDVLVIGGGSAAFDAAVAAREHGAERVVMLEKAPESEYGGNARYSGTGFRFWHHGRDEIREFVPDVDNAFFDSAVIAPYTAEEFFSDLERMTLGRMDPQLARTLVEESNIAIHWMKNSGIRWELLKEHAKVGNKRYFERGVEVLLLTGGSRCVFIHWNDVCGPDRAWAQLEPRTRSTVMKQCGEQWQAAKGNATSEGGALGIGYPALCRKQFQLREKVSQDGITFDDCRISVWVSESDLRSTLLGPSELALARKPSAPNPD